MHNVSPGEELYRGRGHRDRGQRGVQGGEQESVLTQSGEGAMAAGQRPPDTGHSHAGVHWGHVQTVKVDEDLNGEYEYLDQITINPKPDQQCSSKCHSHER